MSDLQLLRAVKTAYKYDIIRFVAHLYTHHADAMTVVDGERLADIIFSDTPIEELIRI